MDDQEENYIALEHDRLISAITKLDKTQHIKEPTRNEPSNLNTEFNLIKSSNRLDLNSVANVLKDTAHHAKISKKLLKVQDTDNVLPKPLEKPQAERIKRATGYQGTKNIVGRWDPVVARNRTVETVVFPLQSKTNKLVPTTEFLSKFKLQSPLEKALEEVDPPAIESDCEEDDQLYPMSYEEMVEHRKQSAKFRAQQSYKAAKAKRQSKIKSKKYHRILKKEKLKQQLQEFEELQKSNPEEALLKLEALEKARALERHTLRHKNTGKWAKSKLIRAKYDKEVRQELAEQLSISRGLTKRTDAAESSDDGVDDHDSNPIQVAQDPGNPWMMKRTDQTNVNAEFDFGYKKYIKGKMYKVKEDDDSDSDDQTVQENDNGEFKKLKEKISQLYENNIKQEKPNMKTEKHVQVKTSYKKASGAKTVATSTWVVETLVNNVKCNNVTNDISNAFDNFESNLNKKVEKKLAHLRKAINTLERPKNTSKQNKSESLNKKHNKTNLEYLQLKNEKIKTIIDEPLIEVGNKDSLVDNDVKINTALLSLKENTKDKGETNIDPSRFIQAKPKYLNTTLPESNHNMDELDDEQIVPKVDIEDVFEEDDVVASFRREKEEEINKDEPKDLDLSLPGWGQWGGKGIKPQKRKSNRFILKAPPKMPRKDENKGDIIIKEYKDPNLAKHKVTEVPYPFSSVKEYEASIRLPLGNTFIPERAHKKLIKPSVLTKSGTIIEPMNEEELLVKKNRSFNNDAIIKVINKQ